MPSRPWPHDIHQHPESSEYSHPLQVNLPVIIGQWVEAANHLPTGIIFEKRDSPLELALISLAGFRALVKNLVDITEYVGLP